MPPDALPKTLQGMFPEGAAVVFSDEQFTAAIPATNKQTGQLTDLFESAAIALDDDFSGALKDYFKFRDELCAPQGYQLLSAVFLQEMEKMKAKEEHLGKSKYAALASAAKFN